MTSPAFYEPLGDGRYAATPYTVGPWNTTDQHAGPPAALLGRAVERCQPREDAIVARFTVEILGPVPVAEVEVAAKVVRPGRSVELLEAELSSGGRVAMRARAWRLRTADIGAPEAGQGIAVPVLPDAGERSPWGGGYVQEAVEWRSAAGGFDVLGPATVWTRLRVGLVAGEQPSPLTRVLAVADSGNGVSNVLDFSAWAFVNTDLTVHLHRMPVGEWVCLDAATTVQPHGVGLAESRLLDRSGPIGRGAQALFVAAR